MDFIERYIYDVTRRIPKNQREDINKELTLLIDDLLFEKGIENEPTKKQIEDVLFELGHPSQMAMKYQDKKLYLIGPEHFFLFSSIIKIIFTVMGSIFALVFLFQTIAEPFHIIDHFTHALTSILTTVPMIIGWTIIGFYLAKLINKDFDNQIANTDQWTLEKLPKVPSEKQRIKRSEPILGIIIYFIMMMFVTISNKYLGLWHFVDGEFAGITPFLSTPMTSLTKILLVFIIGLWIAKEVIKLFYEQWSNALSSIIASINGISLLVVIYLFYSEKIWNENFMGEVVSGGFVEINSEAYSVLEKAWEQSTFWFPILLVIGLVAEIIFSYWRANKQN